VIKRLLHVLGVVPKLGISNVLYILWYRMSLLGGVRKWSFKSAPSINGVFFRGGDHVHTYPNAWIKELTNSANRWIKQDVKYFSYHFQTLQDQWFTNPFAGVIMPLKGKHWTQLDEFDNAVGDIKILWEPSRMNWLLDLGRAYAVTNNSLYLLTMNNWLSDWSRQNPLNIGPNWKCGQETSIRLMKFLSAALILKQYKTPNDELVELVTQHLSRIQPNIRYAIAQDNNHGTSEAAALYVGASWLLRISPTSGHRGQWNSWKELGRQTMIERLNYLVDQGGTFSQKSVNYHRVVVDTVSWTLIHMRELDEPSFCLSTLTKMKALALWQFKMVVGQNGEAPNLGSNDGAMFEILHNCDYRDFRPSTQLAFALLFRKRVFENGPWDEPLHWYWPNALSELKLEKPNLPEAEVLDSQYVILRKNDAVAFCVVPNDRFRPSSCDAFHVDLWVKGENVLCDQGTYSYNAGDLTEKFKSVAAHNSVQFGNHEQMPKIGRFLYANWLNAHLVGKPVQKADSLCWSGAYRVDGIYEHHREIVLSAHSLEVTDKLIAKEDNRSTIRWHSPKSLTHNIKCFEGNNEPIVIEEGKHECSWYYLEKHEVNVYTASSEKRVIKTHITW
jgi:hypothetical protein